MKPLLAFALVLLSGCAFTRPHVQEITVSTNGMILRRDVWLTTYALWPATQIAEKQRGSVGKTLSAGTAGLEQDSGGTNVIEALKVIDSILGKIPK